MQTTLSPMAVWLGKKVRLSMRAVLLHYGVIAICCALVSGTSYAAGPTLQDLQDQIASLSTQISTNSNQNSKIVEIINALIGKPLALVVGSATVKKGSSIELPVLFTKGSPGVAALQFDIKLPNGFTIAGITPGESTLAAQKGLQSNPTQGITRVLIFGINQTILNTGVLARIRLNIAATVVSGNKTVTIQGVVASDAAGTVVPLTMTNGTVTVQ